MATKYYVNKEEQQDTKDHEVHEDGCLWLPAEKNRKYLGEFESCEKAVAEAKKDYKTANGCKHCSEDCHTS